MYKDHFRCKVFTLIHLSKAETAKIVAHKVIIADKQILLYNLARAPNVWPIQNQKDVHLINHQLLLSSSQECAKTAGFHSAAHICNQ